MDDIQHLEKIIEELRQRLHSIAANRCLTDPQVLEASQELNAKINEYERLISKRCSR